MNIIKQLVCLIDNLKNPFLSWQYASLPTWDKNVICNKKGEGGLTIVEIEQ